MKNLKKFFAFSIATAMVAGAVWAGTPGFQALATDIETSYWWDTENDVYTNVDKSAYTQIYTEVWNIADGKYTVADNSKFSISSEAYAVNINNTLQLSVSCSDTAIGNNFSTKWFSRDSNIASISESGLVTGKSAGTVGIYCVVSFSGYNVQIQDKQITVIDPNKVQSVKINDTVKVHDAGTTWSLTATVSPKSATNKNVVWTSSDPSVVEVSPNTGNIYALRAGTATITATSADNDEISDKVEIKVLAKPVDVSITPKDATLYVGGYAEVIATLESSFFKDINAARGVITFKSSDNSIAHVSGWTNKDGKAQLEIGAYKSGDATIIADVTEYFDGVYKVSSDEFKVKVLTESSKQNATDPNAPTSEEQAKQEQTPESIANYQNWLATYGGGDAAAAPVGVTAVSGEVGQPGSEAIVNTGAGEPVAMFQSNDATNTLLAAPVGVVPSGTKIETVEAGKDTPAFKAVQNKLSRISRRGTVQKVYGIAGLNPDGSLLTLINGKAAMSMPMPTDITVPAGKSLKVYLIDDNGQTTKLDTAIDQGRVVFEIPKFGTFAFVVE